MQGLHYFCNWTPGNEATARREAGRSFGRSVGEIIKGKIDSLSVLKRAAASWKMVRSGLILSALRKYTFFPRIYRCCFFLPLLFSTQSIVPLRSAPDPLLRANCTQGYLFAPLLAYLLSSLSLMCGALEMAVAVNTLTQATMWLPLRRCESLRQCARSRKCVWIRS